MEDVAITLRTGDGAVLTVVAVLDHNLGGSVVDGFAVAQDLDAVCARFADADEAPVIREADPADERARVAEALETGDGIEGLTETESWPAMRPLLEWALRQLPEGGRAPDWADPDPAVIARMVEGVRATEVGAGLGEEGAAQVRLLLELAAGYAGDPLRWSPTTVGIQLLDVIPRTVSEGAAFMAGIPDAMAAVVRWAHAERGVAEGLTEETVGAIEEHRQAFLRAGR